MWSDLVRDVLATDRLTRLVTEDEVTRPVREAVDQRWPNSRLAYLVNCRACVSVWAGLAVSSRLVPRPVSWALTLSAAVLWIDRQDERVGALVSARTRGAK